MTQVYIFVGFYIIANISKFQLWGNKFANGSTNRFEIESVCMFFLNHLLNLNSINFLKKDQVVLDKLNIISII